MKYDVRGKWKWKVARANDQKWWILVLRTHTSLNLLAVHHNKSVYACVYMFLLLYYLLRPNWSLSLYVYVFITNCAPVNILRETYTFFTIKRLSIYEIGISCEFRLASHTRSNLLLLSSLPLAFQRPTILHTDSVYIIKSKITNACLSWYLLLIRSPRPSS